MASKEKEGYTTIMLTEQDIPGAELPKPPENCTVAILKRWLSCRGAKVSGKRNELIKRVNDYIRSGLDSKKLIDPDGGINLQNKRRKLGLQEEQETATLVDFPTKGFAVGINWKLHVGYPQIWKFLIDDVEFKKQVSVEKPIVKGYNFYKSGKVQGIYTKQQEELFYIKSQVKSSYDKQDDKHKNIYTVKIIMDTNSTNDIKNSPSALNLEKFTKVRKFAKKHNLFIKLV
ncbi:PREDICTED: uncharacterized protein LOC107347056 [Acropora digitifera]|uniref:uncharacterized protein LOC107347056 n=1 Tax=Acropora digitifera TaxID=70779 RepID=UPI00077AD9A4|nr:PREDICTED: uncharacterized protein LOC107347056 [Acropora digitifera]